MQVVDVMLVGKKIVVGAIVTLIPLAVVSAWFVVHSESSYKPDRTLRTILTGGRLSPN